MARKTRKRTAAEAASGRCTPERRAWKCAVYARLSSKNNGFSDDGSMKAQIAYVKDVLGQRDDIEFVGVYADNGRTGTTFEGRRGFERLMDEVRAGRVDCIACKDLSRFGRNMYETCTYLERIFPFMGVRFIAVNDGLDTLSGDGGITVPFRNLVNEMYALETSRKVGLIKRRQIAEGKTTYGCARYGYRIDREEHRLVPDEETAPFVPLVFDLYLKGERLLDIADALAEMGAPTPAEHLEAQIVRKGDAPFGHVPWTALYVGKLLDDPVYTGLLVMGKTRQSLFEGVAWHKTGEGERFEFPGAHPALVTRDTWEAAHAMRERRKVAVRERTEALAPKREEMPDLFQGVLFCAECGKAMILDRRFNSKTGEARGSVYKCRQHHGRGCGNDVRIPERVVRMAVMDAIRLQISVGVNFEEILPCLGKEDAVARKRAELQDRAKSLAFELARVVSKRQFVYERYAAGSLDLDSYKSLQRDSGMVLADYEKRLAVARDRLEKFDALMASDQGFDEAVAALKSLDVFSRDLLVALVSSVRVRRDMSIDVEFRFEDWAKRVSQAERALR